MSVASLPAFDSLRPARRRGRLWLGALWSGILAAICLHGAAYAHDFLETAYEEALIADEISAYQTAAPLTLARILAPTLAAESEHTWLFQPDYAEDVAHLVELLVNTTPPAPLVAAALEHLGVRYRWGGTDPKRGFDCSGLVVYAARSLGLQLPRTAATQARTGVSVKKSELQAGDLVFFNTRGARYSHVGIYAGDGNFIHAPRTGAVVRVESMKSSYWTKRYTGARRLPGVQVAAK